MVQEIQILQQIEICGKSFQVYGTPEIPMFLAKEVAAFIEHSNPRSMLQSVDEEEKGVRIAYTLGGKQETWFLTEDGLYEVLMQSRKPIAKQFKKGVKAILKEIRTNGGYIAAHQEETPEMIMARALKVAQATIERHQQQLQLAQNTIQQQAPKVKYVDEVLLSSQTYTSTQMAKELNMRTANQLHKELQAKGIMFYQSGTWLLTARYSEYKLTKLKTHTYTKQDGTQGTNSQTVWTEKGRLFLNKTFSKF